MPWNVGSVMTRDVETVQRNTPYKEIVERMRRRRVSALPVVDSHGRVVGMVSEADLLLKEERPLMPLACGEAAKAVARNAAALMTAPALTVDQRRSLSEAARIMHWRRVRRLAVVDDDGRLEGIVTRSDILGVFERSDRSIAEEVREQLLVEMLALDRDAVAVSVDAGVVGLEGELATRSLAWMLVKLAEGVEGVVGVDDRLRWKRDDRHLLPGPPMDGGAQASGLDA
ncbi:MAG: CBS domain-containing protein [Candidatus Dormibacteraeota bacterium]|nr:CBS domain-containing protein [Candidatus Dormibacteraeota bacterium]